MDQIDVRNKKHAVQDFNLCIHFEKEIFLSPACCLHYSTKRPYNGLQNTFELLRVATIRKYSLNICHQGKYILTYTIRIESLCHFTLHSHISVVASDIKDLNIGYFDLGK